MGKRKIVMACCDSASPLPQLIADNLGLVCEPCQAKGLTLLHTVCAKAQATTVLVLPRGGFFNRLATLLFRLRNRHGKTIALDSPLLGDAPKGKELGAWVNTTLLPRMGFQPLATAYNDI